MHTIQESNSDAKQAQEVTGLFVIIQKNTLLLLLILDSQLKLDGSTN